MKTLLNSLWPDSDSQSIATIRKALHPIGQIISAGRTRLAGLSKRNRRIFLGSSAATLLLGGGISAMLSGGGPAAWGLQKLPDMRDDTNHPLPTSVELKAREIFDSRFVEHDGSYYSLIVHYYENISSTLGAMYTEEMQEQLGLAQGTSAPLVMSVDVIQIKDPYTEVKAEELSDADKLNGISWRGLVRVGGGVERRRQLDVMSWAREVIGGNSTASFPWAESALVLAPAILEKIHQEETEEQRKERKVREEREKDPFTSMMTQLFTGDTEGEINLLKLEGWGDWRQCGDSSYQHSTMELRSGEVSHTTLESAGDALVAGNEVSLAPLHTGMMNMAAKANDPSAFLTKPNLEALIAAGILED